MRLLARRTGRNPDWRDKCPLEERAAAVGVELKLQPNGKEVANIRANKRSALAKEEAYLVARPVLPPMPAAPPPDTPGEMRVGAERALAFERITGEFSLGTCVACRETRLNATYRKSRRGEKICLRCHSDKQVIYTDKNNALPAWRDADGGKHYDVPFALADLAPCRKASNFAAICNGGDTPPIARWRCKRWPHRHVSEAGGTHGGSRPEIAIRRDHYPSEARRPDLIKCRAASIPYAGER